MSAGDASAAVKAKALLAAVKLGDVAEAEKLLDSGTPIESADKVSPGWLRVPAAQARPRTAAGVRWQFDAHFVSFLGFGKVPSPGAERVDSPRVGMQGRKHRDGTHAAGQRRQNRGSGKRERGRQYTPLRGCVLATGRQAAAPEGADLRALEPPLCFTSRGPGLAVTERSVGRRVAGHRSLGL